MTKLKYKDYKLLSKDQKEEYNYLYSKDKKIQFPLGLLIITGLMCIIIMLSAVVFVIDIDTVFTQAEITQFVFYALNVMYWGATVTMILFLVSFIDFVVYEWKKRKWIKNALKGLKNKDKGDKQ